MALVDPTATPRLAEVTPISNGFGYGRPGTRSESSHDRRRGSGYSWRS